MPPLLLEQLFSKLLVELVPLPDVANRPAECRRFGQVAGLLRKWLEDEKGCHEEGVIARGFRLQMFRRTGSLAFGTPTARSVKPLLECLAC